ncbi:MAG: M48 family metalloprotease [Betaproteobacteria bacterium]|nr:M48 family metalloprotease [Betaproteobacteria bacterium]MDH5349903.1 M48 family metalloprotease [Betaproteobacteria bacterium]
MDFFAQQDTARRASRWLVLWYLLAVAFVILSFNVAAALLYALLALFGALPLAGGAPLVWTGLWSTYGQALLGVPPAVHYAVSGAVAAIVLAVTAHRMWQLSEGGPAVAALLGAHYLDRSRVAPAEARVLNVVDEMAIASGIAVPPVYLLEREDAINALVAGHSPNEAVIIVTRGAVHKLSRDELQGVMGHEFSHILNGDMALNLRLVALLAGIACFGEWGEAMVFAAAEQARKSAREERGEGVLGAIFGALVAYIGFPGSFAAEAIKAAIARQRELLADAASVQFTRNPDGIAGALDSIRYLGAGTTLRSAYVSELSHMFFAPAVVHWWAFPTHPPLEERIRRAHPRFMREDYRRTRHAGTYRDGRVAVLDGAGNVVKVLGGIGAVAAAATEGPRREHVDHARRLLERLPQALKARLASPEAAQAAVLELVSGALPGARRHDALLLIELALPALRQLPQKRRDAFIAEVNRRVQADRKVTLAELVQATFLRQHLREGAGKPIPTKFRKVDDVAGDAQAVLSLIAHASQGDTAAAHAKGGAILGLALPAPAAVAELTSARIVEALERLRHLQPFEKPRVLKACVEAAAADGQFRLAEMELVRAVAATLDCPLPPVIGALDPATLAA